jgi:hypothetical protein
MPKFVHLYDYLKKTLLFKISVTKVKSVHFLEEEQILAVLKDNDSIELYSVQQMTHNWRRIIIERSNSMMPKRQKTGSVLTNHKNNHEDQEEALNLCEVVNFDERVKQVVMARAYCKKGFFAAVTNTKFQVYLAYVDIEEVQRVGDDNEHEEGENEDDIDIHMPSTVRINCSKVWDVSVRINLCLNY